MEEWKREVSESGTARSSHCVCAQASAQGGTKGPLYYQKHKHKNTHVRCSPHYWLSKFDCEISSLVSLLFCCSHLGKLPFSCPFIPLVFSVDQPLARLHLSSCPHPFVLSLVSIAPLLAELFMVVHCAKWLVHCWYRRIHFIRALCDVVCVCEDCICMCE